MRIVNHPDGLVGHIFRKVIALLWSVRCLNESVVFDEVGIPLIGFASEETIEAVEAFLEGPFLAAGARCDVLATLWSLPIQKVLQSLS